MYFEGRLQFYERIMMFENLIYMDNASSTRLDERVLAAMSPYFFEIYAVATSEFGYSMGIEAKDALTGARETLAGILKASPEELIFTSGSAESSNAAIKGVAQALRKKKGDHIITTRIEDFPVLHSARALEREGFEVTYLEVDGWGRVDLDGLQEAIKKETILVSVQHANQEIGTIQDVLAVGQICRDEQVIFHTDATHTFCRVPLDIKSVPADLITISAHTIHGPRGTGGLYIRDGTPISKWMDGGFQEFDRRGGLENIPGAVGFARAAELVTPLENEALQKMRDRIIHRALSEISDTVLNGHPEERTPQNANISFHQVEGESITLHLDLRGIAVSTGSACFSRSLEASHVITGIGGDHERAHGSVRLTLGRYNSREEVEKVMDEISDVVLNLRKISPLGKRG